MRPFGDDGNGVGLTADFRDLKGLVRRSAGCCTDGVMGPWSGGVVVPICVSPVVISGFRRNEVTYSVGGPIRSRGGGRLLDGGC